MADTSIDKLSIDIDYSANTANAGLAKLKSALQELNTIVTPATQNLGAISRKLNSFGKATQQLNSANLLRFSTGLKAISNSVVPLTQLGKTNLGSFINQLKKIPDLNKTLDEKSIAEFTVKIQKLSNAMVPLATNLTKVGSVLSSMPSKLNKISSQSSKVNGTVSALSGLSKALNFGAMIALGRRAGQFLGDFITQSNKYVEDLNLFNVAMGESTEKAKEFIDTVSDKLGLDPANMMRYMGVFQMIANGFGLGADNAYKMSKNLTQLTYDISSFYNIDIDEAAQKVQSAISGELEPVRRLGYALDQATLKQIALNNGIEKSFTDMTQAEKAQLRYIALLTQNVQVQGDMGRTIMSSANAIRVLKQQFQLLGREIGNIFIPVLMKIIPVAIAVVKVLGKIAQAIAKMFGFKLPELNWDSVNAAAGGVENLEEDLDDATGAAKKLKRQLAGFDELNNLTSPNQGGGSGANTDLGAGFELDLPGYDMLEGYTKGIDDLTNQVMKFLGLTEDAYGNLSWNFWDMDDKAKLLLITLGTLIGIKGIAGVAGAISNLKTGWEVVKGTFSLGWLGKIGSGILTFIGNPLADINLGITAVSEGWATMGEAAQLILGSLGSTLLSIGAIVIGVVLPIVTLYNGIKEVSKGVIDLTGATDLFGDTVSTNILGLPFAFKKADESISDTTKEALTPFISKLNELGSTIWDLNLGDIVTQEDVQNVKSQTQELANTLNTNIIAKTNEMKAILDNTDLFPDPEKRQKYLEVLDQSLADEQEMIKMYQNDINAIVEKAAAENRNITDVERVKINELQRQMGEDGIKILSASEQESLTLQARFNDKYGALTTEQLMDTVKKSKELKDKTTQEAQEEYDKKVGLAEQMKKTLPGFTEDMYNEMIEDAQKNKDETIKKAEEAYQGIVDKVQEKYPEVSRTINFETGEQKNGIEVAATWIGKTWDDITKGISDNFNETKQKWHEVIDNLPNYIEEKKNRIAEKFDEIKTKIGETFENVKKSIKEKIQGALDWLKDHFKFPDIKLPHLTWTTEPANGWVGDILSTLGLPSSLPKLNVSWYAKGGFPETGQFFMARESGPELVGQIGNRTAVANNDQIIAGIQQGVYSAMVEAQGSNSGSQNIYIGNRQVYKSFSSGLRTENNRLGKAVVSV